MNTHETTENKKQRDDRSHQMSGDGPLALCSEIEKAFAETLLEQVEQAQALIQGLTDDIALLQTAENALDLISDNLAKIQRLTRAKLQGNLSRSDEAEINDRINNLMMITMLTIEDTEYNDHRLFQDDVILLRGIGNERLFLATSRIPDIRGIETNDCDAVLADLNAASQVINRQYQRISTALRALLCEYNQLRNEIDSLITTHIYHRR